MATIYKDTTNKYQTSTYALEKTADAPDFISVFFNTVGDVLSSVLTMGVSSAGEGVGKFFSNLKVDLDLGKKSANGNPHSNQNNGNNTTMIAVVVIVIIIVLVLVFKKKKR